MQGVEAQRLEARERKDKWEAEELRGFALARANQTGALCFCMCVLYHRHGGVVLERVQEGGRVGRVFRWWLRFRISKVCT